MSDEERGNYESLAKTLRASSLREYVSNVNGVAAVAPKDCAAFAETMLKAWKKRARKGSKVAIITSKLWAEHWQECADDAGEEPFRVWLSRDLYVIFKKCLDDTFIAVVTWRAAGGNAISVMPPAPLSVIAAEMQKMIDVFIAERVR